MVLVAHVQVHGWVVLGWALGCLYGADGARLGPYRCGFRSSFRVCSGCFGRVLGPVVGILVGNFMQKKNKRGWP